MTRIKKFRQQKFVAIWYIIIIIISYPSYEVTLKYYGECIKTRHIMVCDSYM